MITLLLSNIYPIKLNEFIQRKNTYILILFSLLTLNILLYLAMKKVYKPYLEY